MEKDKFEARYKLVRTIGVPIFKKAFNPTIINSELIPSEGPIILCGNHLHVWDQFPVICATKRTTHWLSKKEYFDGKLGPFFRFTGAIAVDRFGDTTSSKNESQEYLEIGSAIGMFPEGTRNGLKKSKIEELYNLSYKDKMSKEEFFEIMLAQNPLLSQINLLEELKNEKRISTTVYEKALLNCKSYLNELKDYGFLTSEEYNDSLLLPFKFGAVSLAAKTNAKIVPFAVNGDYKVGNDNLIVRFAEPITCNVDTLEEDNTKLRNKILSLEKKNLENIKK